MNFHPELPTPPPLAPDTLRMVALGGLGEVGRNMHVVELNGRLLIIDCGVLFPEENQPGVDLVLPDLSYLEDRLDDIEAMVLTHGHEDHIGAVPYLLRMRQDIPILGSQLTLAFLEAKLAEHRIKPITLAVKEGQREKIKAFDLEFVGGQPLDPRRARRVRAHVRGHDPQHRRLQDGPAAARRPHHGPALLRPLRRGGRRPLPGGLHQRRGPRLHHVRDGDRADARPALRQRHGPHHRRVLREPRAPRPAGHRRRHTHTADASPSWAARWCATWASPRIWASSRCPTASSSTPRRPTTCRPNKVVFMSTGSQGEPMAALSRMANGDHKVEVGKGDLVILASSPDPRQRERGVPRHQRADAPRRHRGAPVQRARARLRPRVARASCCTATTSCAPRT